MKKNLPVTGTEVYLPVGESVISTTDLKGIITFVNKTFCDVSGFCEEELIGKSHNIVRHPDMPEAAFKDLWATVKKGKPWNGVVKNRCKNGDHYWVDAFAMPVIKDGVTVAYISVRHQASAEQIKFADRLYGDVRSGKKKLRRSVLQRLYEVDLKTRFHIAMFISSMPAIVAMVLALAGLVGPWYVVIASIVSLLMDSALVAWMTRDILNSLYKATELLSRAAIGDLSNSLKIRSRDQMGLLSVAASNMVVSMRSLMQTSRYMLQTTESSAKHLAQASASLSDSTAQQAALGEEIAQAMTQMAKHIGQNTENAEQTNNIASASSEVAVVGVESMNNALTAMQAIAQKVQAVQDIAWKTNLLALNAAIEAARAGEQGKGFAVVADEVRSLAQSSQLAADEIDQLVQRGVMVTECASSRLAEIFTQIQTTASLVQEITKASRSQSQRTLHIEGSIRQLENAVQQNAATSEEVSGMSQELLYQSGHQKKLVEYFTLS